MFDHVEEKLRQVLADNLKIDKSLIQHGSKLEDWGGDSLLFLETVFEIETSFDIQFPDTANEKISDFDSLAALVKKLLAKKPNATS